MAEYPLQVKSNLAVDSNSKGCRVFVRVHVRALCGNGVEVEILRQQLVSVI